MRYYELNANGQVIRSYAVPQPEKPLLMLPKVPDDESKWDGSEWVPDTEKINARLAAIAELDAEEAEIAGAFPTWAEIETAIDNATLAQMKVIIKKGFKVLYNLALWRRKIMAVLRSDEQ